MNALDLNSCSICLEELSQDQPTVSCENQPIAHIFHRHCAESWANQRPGRPLCPLKCQTYIKDIDPSKTLALLRKLAILTIRTPSFIGSAYIAQSRLDFPFFVQLGVTVALIDISLELVNAQKRAEMIARRTNGAIGELFFLSKHIFPIAITGLAFLKYNDPNIDFSKTSIIISYLFMMHAFAHVFSLEFINTPQSLLF